MGWHSWVVHFSFPFLVHYRIAGDSLTSPVRIDRGYGLSLRSERMAMRCLSSFCAKICHLPPLRTPMMLIVRDS